jgi:predicted GIY-YIG superfamily endonuclease
MAVSEPSHWIVYILECADQTLYTGITNDLDHRINEHENGRGAKLELASACMRRKSHRQQK